MSLSNLLPELLFEILTRLPPKDLLRSLCVSKSWNATIRSRRFIKAHLQRSAATNSDRALLVGSYPSDFFSVSFDDSEAFGECVEIAPPLKCPEPAVEVDPFDPRLPDFISARWIKCPAAYTEIIGRSVHGLVCIRKGGKGEDGDIAFWNPSIQKFKMIPPTTFEADLNIMTKLGSPCYAFGYDSINDDYKLVGFVEFRNKEPLFLTYSVQIYSLKSNSWKRIQNINIPWWSYYVFDLHNIVYVNGALCWLMDDGSDIYTIVTLDLATEECGAFPAPVDKPYLFLEVLGDCLYICVRHGRTRHDGWIMKEFGVAESWTLIYSINEEDSGSLCRKTFHYKPLVFSKNSGMVLFVDDYYMLFWIDIEEDTVKEVDIHGFPPGVVMVENYSISHPVTVTICVGSLCLLDGDDVLAARHQQGPSYLEEAESSKQSEESLDLALEAAEDDQN
ncbi:hypothetical protein EV1_023927 [Malus domestica]|uniref:F-box protein CPR1-like n=1 Tax=Malus domestica TaxID=3750 RepID=UPI000498D0F4|nr:F-box protein CPR1-like [Malus domestica]